MLVSKVEKIGIGDEDSNWSCSKFAYEILLQVDWRVFNVRV